MDIIEGIDRNKTDDAPDSRVQNITYWADKVKHSKDFFKKDFERMTKNMKFVRGIQWVGQVAVEDEDDRYIANFLQHHIQNKMSSLYARNPTVVSKYKNRLNFAIWDEDQSSLQAAQQNIMMATQAQMMPNPQDVMLLQDYNDGMARKRMLNRLSKTLEIVSKHQMDEQPDDFKLQMKMLISRVAINGVGYIKTLYQKETDYPRNIKTQIEDIVSKMQRINRLRSDLIDGETNPDDAQAEQLRISLETLKKSEKVVIREGLIFEFPKSTKVIIDPLCSNIEGFVDANWIAQEYLMTADQIKEYYQVDLSSSSDATVKTEKDSEGKTKDSLICVWEIQDKGTGSFFTICDGYKNYLKEPSSPNVEIESFFSIKALVLNKAEDEECIYPISDVTLLKSIQDEYNRTREALRQHRIANKPLYLADRGSFEEDEENAIANASPHEVIYVNGDGETSPGQKVVPLQKAAIDPNVYQTNDIFSDVQRTVGAPEAQFGGTANTTATESSIAASSRMTTVSSNSDDIDDFLTRFFRDVGVILLTNMSPERVKKIAGQGAVWPSMNYSDIIDEVYLSIEAGSSGRPNKGMDISNFERIGPLLLQIPGINPEYLAKYVLKINEDGLDLTEALSRGAPSIMSLNGMNQLGTGDSLTDPSQQGRNGKNNSVKGDKPQGASQSMFPTGQF